MSFQMKNAYARRALQAASATLFAALGSVAHANWGGLNMPEGVTILSKKIYWLHQVIRLVCVGLAVVVFGAMIYSLIKFRRSKGAEPDKTMVHSTKVEIIWTIVPILILVGTEDGLLSLDTRLHDELVKHGKNVRMDVYEHGYHDFVLGNQGQKRGDLPRGEILLPGALEALELTVKFVKAPR